MPELSRFPSGLIVRIHWTKDEEGRPHIHGFHSGKSAKIYIASKNVVLPPKERQRLSSKDISELVAWMIQYEVNLLYSWHLCELGETPPKIPPPKPHMRGQYDLQVVPDWFIRKLEQDET